MKFCIIGDSWALNCPGELGYKAIDQILEQKGHTVTNLAAGGASNFGQLLLLDFQVLQQGNTNFDYILWFHVEPARDFTNFISLDYGVEVDNQLGLRQFPGLTFRHFFKDLNYINNQNYIYSQQLYEKYHIPFLVVGASGKLNESIKNFSFVHWHLDCWLQQVLNLENSKSIAVNYLLHHVVRMCDNGSYNRNECLLELELLDMTEKIIKDNPAIFPDGCHVGEQYYIPLMDQILKSI